MSTGILNIFSNYKKSEDNITHGFLSLLQCLETSTSKDIIQKLIRGIRLSHRQDIIFDIQSPSPQNRHSFQTCEKGYLLGISSIGIQVVQDNSTRSQSRADGWICDGTNLILIESKVGSEFSQNQLDRHEKQLKSYELQLNPSTYITWQEIDSVLKSINDPEELNPTQNKLISEYRRYLQMEGQTLDFEKFFNATGKNINIGQHWASDAPKRTLRLLKHRIVEQIDTLDAESKEQLHETAMNHYWLRLFEKQDGPILWRGTIYLRPDAVSVDVLAFNPNKGDMVTVIQKLMQIGNDQKDNNKLRTWVYITNYGKRRNVQMGKDYEYCCLNCNLGKGPSEFSEFLVKFAESSGPKQIGIRYSISNPGSKSKTYWDESGPDVNHEDAEILKDPDEVVNRFVCFLKQAME